MHWISKLKRVPTATSSEGIRCAVAGALEDAAGSQVRSGLNSLAPALFAGDFLQRSVSFTNPSSIKNKFWRTLTPEMAESFTSGWGVGQFLSGAAIRGGEVYGSFLSKEELTENNVLTPNARRHLSLSPFSDGGCLHFGEPVYRAASSN